MKNPSTTGIFHFLFHTTVLNYTYCTGSPEFKGLKLEIKFLFICSFLFCWIRIGTLIPDLDKSSGSNRIRFHSTGNHIIEPNFLIQISNQHDADRNSANNFYRTVVVEQLALLCRWCAGCGTVRTPWWGTPPASAWSQTSRPLRPPPPRGAPARPTGLPSAVRRNLTAWRPEVGQVRC